MEVPMISVAQCLEMIRAGKPLRIIDVRTPAEYGRVHAAGARLMPLDTLDPAAIVAVRPDPAQPLYVICHSGSRASKACKRLMEAGIANVHCVEGGTTAWEAGGLAVERGPGKVISLERQVRIVAGALVLVGVILALTVHVAFMGLSAFIGAGLMFAGITDFCGMGILLGKMPWNQRAAMVTPPCAAPAK